MVLKKIPGYLFAYLLWIVVLLLGLWLAVLSRSVLLAFAASFAGELYSKQVIVRFWDKVYQVVLGLAWLSVMIISEETFRKAASKGSLLTKFASICGIELLLIFIFDFLLLFQQNFVLEPLRLIVLVIELTVGIGLVIYWRSRKKLKST